MADSGNDDQEHFDGRRVREIRQARRLTQEQLAQRVGISRNALSMIESGRFFPKLRTLFSLARELRVSVADLVGGSSEQTVDPEFQPLIDALTKLPPAKRRVFISSQTDLLEQFGGPTSAKAGQTGRRKRKGGRLRLIHDEGKPSKER